MGKHQTYINNNIYKKQKVLSIIKKTFIVVVLVLLCNFLSAKIFNYNFLEEGKKALLRLAGVYTEPIPQVSFESDGWDIEGGSWHVDKSAEWTAVGKARVRFDVSTALLSEEHYQDVILILDRSGSMLNEKIDKVKQDTKDLIETLLRNPNNRIGIISFSVGSSILSELTNDKQTLNEIVDNIEADGTTNYNAALKNAQKMLEEYKERPNTSLTIMFLTDGYPNEETPNQIATYNIIKQMKPDVIINGVQYEMGTYIAPEIVQISDNQYSANMETLENILYDATIESYPYENFEIVDYIEDEYFFINDENDINISCGSVKLELEDGKQKITWNLGPDFKTGKKASMEINLTLKETYAQNDGFYPTNEREIITSKIPDKPETKVDSNDTPVLKQGYKVTYDTNTPTGCDLKEKDKQVTHYVFENVNYYEEGGQLTCNNYIFKGWEIDTKESDGISKNLKKVNDDIFVMPDHDVVVRGVWVKPAISKSMEGTIHEKETLYKAVIREAESSDSSMKRYYSSKTGLNEGDGPIYYNGNSKALDKDNVIFNGFCWEIVRTTTTKGVKIVYSGLPDENNRCDNTGNNLTILDSDGYHETRFNRETSLSYSPAGSGYMYNDTYTIGTAGGNTLLAMLDSRYSLNTSYYYSSTMHRDTDTGMFVLDDPQTYNLNGEDPSENTNVSGKYTCLSGTNTSCRTIYYVEGYENGYLYYDQVTTTTQIEMVYEFGKTYSKNSNGTYKLEEIKEVKLKDYFNEKGNIVGYYYCDSGTSEECKELSYVVGASSSYVRLTDATILYGTFDRYDSATNTYYLTNTSDYGSLGGDFTNNHYSCDKETSCTNPKFFFAESNGQLKYVTLSDGKKGTDVLDEMLSDNAKDSSAKAEIDAWFETNLADKQSKYLEDIVFCNNRTIEGYAGWADNGSLTSRLNFDIEYNSLACQNETDRFSTSNPKAKLKYPVGMLTIAESYQFQLASITRKGRWWTLDPYFFGAYQSGNSIILYMMLSSISYSAPGSSAGGLRPVVSLKNDVTYSQGDGSRDNPYIVD